MLVGNKGLSLYAFVGVGVDPFLLDSSVFN